MGEPPAGSALRSCAAGGVRSRRRGGAAAALAGGCLFTTPAQATNLLANGNFATGSIAGWSTGGSYVGYPSFASMATATLPTPPDAPFTRMFPEPGPTPCRSRAMTHSMAV